MCLTQPDCLAFDFDMNFDACYAHTRDDYLKDLIAPTDNVDQYRRVRCPTVGKSNTSEIYTQS